MAQVFTKPSKRSSLESWFYQITSQWFYQKSHALLGLYCLFHFIYRFNLFFVYERDDMGFGTLTTENLVLVFLPHVLLQLSGFAFDIPEKRYKDGFRIWPQYRWEAVFFAGRSLALMALAWHRNLYGSGMIGDEDNDANRSFGQKVTLMALAWHRKLNGSDIGEYEEENDANRSFWLLSGHSVWPAAAIVIATILCADVAAAYFRWLGHESRTLRDQGSVPQGFLYLAAAAQFHANVHCLLTSDKLCVQLTALAVVQITAFFMTLRRNNIINVLQGNILYGLGLVLGMAVIASDLMDRGILGIGITLGNVAALVRFDLGLNKYKLWILVAFLMQFISTDSDSASSSWLGGKSAWDEAAVFSTGLLLAGAARRQQQMSMKKAA